MTPIEWALWSLVTAAGLAGSALCSGVESGLYSVNRVRVDIAASGTRRPHAARLLRTELDRPERAIATLLVGNNAANYAGAAGITALLAGAGFTDAAVVVINAMILTPVLVVFCESLPKELFRQNADRLAVAFAPLLSGARVVLTVCGVLPLVMLLGRLAVRLVGQASEQWAQFGARERLAKLLEEGAAQGALSAAQATLAERAMAMRDATVEDEMVPWSKVRWARSDWPREQLIKRAAEHPHADLPVVDGRGRVVGVVWQVEVHLRPSASWSELLREPARLSPTVGVLEAMRLVLESEARVGIVEREGKAVGFVTLEDLVEPLTGEAGV